MSKKNKKKKKPEEDIIIGYTSKRKKDKSPKKKKSKWKKIKKILFTISKIIIIFAALIGIGAFFFVSPIFNITEIKVENANKISENTYIALSEIEIGENIFRINKSKIKQAILSESYVEELEIKRELPGTVCISVNERIPKYMIEKNGGIYAYIDKNGYVLEETTTKLEEPILKGILTDVEKIKPGDRIDDKDLDKFNDLIKIADGIKNNNIKAKISIIDITDSNNYILEISEEKKKVMLGDVSDLSTKMIWIKYLIEKNADTKGTIYLNNEKVYFSKDNES